MPKALITTVPFGDRDPFPLQALEAAGIDYLINPIGRKLSEDELAEMVSDFDVLIAGTEPITEKVLVQAKNLKLISRVGIGLDNVDLLKAQRRKIQVSYTPDAPTNAVAELTICMMLTLLRHVHLANNNMHVGLWNRYFGHCISEVVIGIIGLGRIGLRVIELLAPFKPTKILVNDSANIHDFGSMPWIQYAKKEEIYTQADLISLHVPLTGQTKNMIGYEQLKSMKKDAMVINTSRGGVINELDLTRVLRQGFLAGVAIDVFEQEPYKGQLRNIERCLMTSHMGSMSVNCRTRMEIEATEEVVRFFAGQPLWNLVQQEEYDNQRQGS